MIKPVKGLKCTTVDLHSSKFLTIITSTITSNASPCLSRFGRRSIPEMLFSESATIQLLSAYSPLENE